MIDGNAPSGSAPDSVYASVWHTPVATLRISTSPFFGPARSTSSTLSGFPASHATAALVFIVRSPLKLVSARLGVDCRGLLGPRTGAAGYSPALARAARRCRGAHSLRSTSAGVVR